MLNEKLETALNTQLNREIFSAYLYFSMSAWFSSRNLKGFANWMYVQGLEELTHAKRIYDYIIHRGGEIRLKAVEAPKSEWHTPMEVFQETLEHETGVTASINRLVIDARATADHATEIFLQWFVTEQVEEEGSALEIIERLKMAGDNSGALLMLDGELGTRTLALASAETT